MMKEKVFFLEFTSSGIIWLSLVTHKAGTGDCGACPPLTLPVVHVGGKDSKGYDQRCVCGGSSGSDPQHSGSADRGGGFFGH